MAATEQTLPVRMYQTRNRVMVAAPMPGLEPGDIEITVDAGRLTVRSRERARHQHRLPLLLAEWSIGAYHREIALPMAVSAELTNVTYDNGVLVVCMPKVKPGSEPGRAEIRLDPVEATRGEHVGHVGRDIIPTSTREHRSGKHRTPRWTAPSDPRDTAPPAK